MLINTGAFFNTRDLWNSPGQISAVKYAANLWTEVRARGFTFGQVRKESKGWVVWRYRSEQLEYLRVISGHLQLQWEESVCVCVCWRHSVCESMRDGSVPLCCTSAGSTHFRSPSSPWMVFLMRSRRVVCHWSRREMESNSLTWVSKKEN